MAGNSLRAFSVSWEELYKPGPDKCIEVSGRALNADTMLNHLKVHIQNREADRIMDLVTHHPEVLEATDEKGSTGFLLIAYSGLEDAFTYARQHKKVLTFPEAIVGGDIAQVKAYLAHDEDIGNRHSDDGFTPLSLASFFNQTEIAELLLSRGADPDLSATNSAKVNALHAAVAKENLELCRKFLEHGANVNAPQAQNVTPLHSAAHRGNLPLVKLLVKFGADISFRMDNGDTAISIAHRDDHLNVKDYLEEALKKSPFHNDSE